MSSRRWAIVFVVHGAAMLAVIVLLTRLLEGPIYWVVSVTVLLSGLLSSALIGRQGMKASIVEQESEASDSRE